MANKENFIKFVKEKDTSAVKQIIYRAKNKDLIRESQYIALKILLRLCELKWTQVKLAKEMGVSPQQVNKIVRAKENNTTETLLKIQRILNIPIFASYVKKETQIISNPIIIKLSVVEKPTKNQEPNYSESSFFFSPKVKC